MSDLQSVPNPLRWYAPSARAVSDVSGHIQHRPVSSSGQVAGGGDALPQESGHLERILERFEVNGRVFALTEFEQPNKEAVLGLLDLGL